MMINLTTAAVIIWSGMLVIAGAVIVLSSQVRHLVELLESQTNGPNSATSLPSLDRRPRTSPGLSTGRTRNSGARVTLTSSNRSSRRFATSTTTPRELA